MKKIYIVAMVACTLLSCGNNKSDNSSKEYQDIPEGYPTLLSVPYSEVTVNPKEGKTVLIVSGSPRRGGNTDFLCDEFARGAEEVGGKVDKLFLADYDLKPLSEEGAERQHDEVKDSLALSIVRRFLNADVVVLASPVYYMNVTDRMKIFIDNTYLLYSDERMGGKEYYYITACADPKDGTAECAFFAFRGFVGCLPSGTERGYVKATGIGRKGAVNDSQFAEQAYELGKSINRQ